MSGHLKLKRKGTERNRNSKYFRETECKLSSITEADEKYVFWKFYVIQSVWIEIKVLKSSITPHKYKKNKKHTWLSSVLNKLLWFK